MSLLIDLSDLEYKRLKRLVDAGWGIAPSIASVAAAAIRAGLRVLERRHVLSEDVQDNLDDEIVRDMLARCACKRLVHRVANLSLWNDMIKPGSLVECEILTQNGPTTIRGYSAGPAMDEELRCSVLPLMDGTLVPLDRCKLVRDLGYGLPMVPQIPVGWQCDRCGAVTERNGRWSWDGRNWRHDCPAIREVLREIGELQDPPAAQDVEQKTIVSRVLCRDGRQERRVWTFVDGRLTSYVRERLNAAGVKGMWFGIGHWDRVDEPTLAMAYEAEVPQDVRDEARTRSQGAPQPSARPGGASGPALGLLKVPDEGKEQGK